LAGDDDIGYGRPPKAHQFRKGHSGNLKGRPKKAKSIRTTIAKELVTPIRASIGGRPKSMPVFQAILKQMIADALKGNAKARNELLALAHLHCPELFAEEARKILSEDRAALLRRLIARESPTGTDPGGAPAQPAQPVITAVNCPPSAIVRQNG
jgi:hypothetical protein